MTKTRSGLNTLTKATRSKKPRRSQQTPLPSVSDPVMHDPTQSLSNFIYYKKNGEEINIDIRMGSILNEHCDAIAFTVNESLNLNAALPKKVLSKTGVANAVKKDTEKAKQSRKYLAGDVAAIDLTDSDNDCGWKSLFFVVVPHEPTLQRAYTNIFDACEERQHSSLAIVGLGCDVPQQKGSEEIHAEKSPLLFIAGQTGISAKTSANCFMEALMQFDNEKGFSEVKSIAVLDVQRDVVQFFISKLHEFVQIHHYNQTNSGKLVFVSNDNLLDYEARRLTSQVDRSLIEERDCVVCLCPLRDEEEVCALKCNHQFHFACFKNYLQQCMTRKYCPICRKYFAMPCGNQPADAVMSVYRTKLSLPGFKNVKSTLIIHYHIPSGVQDHTHLRPGVPYKGTTRIAYLPDNKEGKDVLRLLRKAFECRLVFTVGDSITTGMKNVVTWNSIHHKTSPTGGLAQFGYPDETYFVRVRAELEEAGITEDLLTEADQDLLIQDTSNGIFF